MKKTDIALILGVIIVVIISIFAFSGSKNKIEKPLTLADDFKGVKEITYSDYNSMVEENKNFILLIIREGCTYCESFLPIVEETSTEKNIPVYIVDIATFTDDELSDFYTSNKFLSKGEWGTPTTLVLQGSQVVDSLEGLQEKEDLIEFLDENVKIAEKSE